MPTRDRATPREIRKLWTALAEPEREAAAERAQRGATPGKLPGGSRPETGRARDRIGRLAGCSGRTVEKCVAVYAAAERDPALFGEVAAYMERTENIDDAHNRMRRVADLDRTSRLAAVEGRFATLVLDPPWQDESVSENQRPPYATMPLAAISALPVPGWVGERAHLYCHAPGPFVPTAAGLLAGWGFAFKTVLTWRKPRFSMGRYFRPQAEFVVFGTRGGLMLARRDLPNAFDGLTGEHSEKPDAFYELVRRASPPPYGEAFQRQARPGFVDLFGIPPNPTVEAAE